MFENIKLAREREIIRDTKKDIDNLRFNKYRAISYHLSSLLVTTIAFTLVLYSTTAYRASEANLLPALASLLFAIIFIFSHEKNKRKPKYIDSILSSFMKLRIHWLRHWHADYLAKYFWIALAVLAVLVLFLLMEFVIGPDGWIDSKVIQENGYPSSINMLLTMAIGLLATQVTLFGFVMQQVLGKYSGVVAQTAVSHKAIKVLMLYPIFGLSILFVITNYGYPRSIHGYLLPVVGVMLLSGLFISMIVATSGLRESLAIRYVGESYSRRIKKAIPSPIDNKSRSSRYFWLPLNFLGLDFRGINRYQTISVPEAGVEMTIESLGALLGVANKAVVDGQHDVFVASLTAMERVMQAYSEKRILYFSSEDTVFSYLNYQLAALIESAAKAPNQYLVSNLAATVGRISKLTYCIGRYPEDVTGETNTLQNSNNFSTALWMGLLLECFEQTHKLTRSTAAHESIIQMANLAETSIERKDSDAITLTYLPTIQKVYMLCIIELADPYHQNLAGMCLKKLIGSLFYIVQNREQLIRGTHQDPFDEALKLISEYSKLYLTVNPSGTLSLDDPVNTLLSKLAQDQYCLQEIFFVTANSVLSNKLAYSVAKSDLSTIIKTNTDLGKFAVAANVYTSPSYLDALFEMAYIVIRGLPRTFKEYDDRENKDRASYQMLSDSEDTERQLTVLIFESFRDLYGAFYLSTRLSLDWQQSILSFIGIAIMRLGDTNDAYLREQIIETSQLMYSLIKSDWDTAKRPHYDSDKYLQLLGAWLEHFDIDSNLADEIIDSLSARIPSSSHPFSGSSGERYGLYGYPTIHYSDFYLYPLSNIRHPEIMSQSAWESFSVWGDSLICDDVLLPYYSKIQQANKKRDT